MKEKYPRTMHFPFSPGTTSDDRIASVYSNFEGPRIIITEKLDGQNDCVKKKGVYARSHAAPSELPWDRVIWDIQARIKDALDELFHIFGENMYAIHSLQYTELISYYYIFGIRDNNIWLSWDDVVKYAELFELPTVPVLFDGTTDDIKSLVEKLVSEPSVLGGFDTQTGQKMKEGVVVRIADAFEETFPNKKNYCFENVIKWVRKDHVNTDEHWTRNWKVASLNYNLL